MPTHMTYLTNIRPVRGALAVCLLVGVFLAVAAVPAIAARGHVFGSAFGWGVNDGKPELQTCTTECKPGTAGSGAGQFKLPAGAAVNEATGNVYVVDEGNNRVEVFDAAGAFLSEIKGPFTTATGTGDLTSGSKTIKSVATATGAFNPAQEITGPGLPAGTTIVAVGGETFEAKTLEANALGLSQAATETQPGASLTAHQSFAGPTTIAVDNSCVQRKAAEPKLLQETCEKEDPSNGDVYVQDGFEHKVVGKFTAAGKFLGQIPVPHEGPAREVNGVAVDAHGELWVSDGSTGSGSGFDKFSNASPNKHIEFSTDAGLTLSFGLAVDSEENLYASLGFEAPFDRVIARFDAKREGAGEHKVLDEETSAGVATALPRNDAYINNLATVARFGSAGDLIERFGEGHLRPVAISKRSKDPSSTTVAASP